MESEFNRGHFIARCPLNVSWTSASRKKQADENTLVSLRVAVLGFSCCSRKLPGVVSGTERPKLGRACLAQPSATVFRRHRHLVLAMRGELAGSARRHPPATRRCRLGHFRRASPALSRSDRSARTCTTPRMATSRDQASDCGLASSDAQVFAVCDRPDRLVGHTRWWHRDPPSFAPHGGEITRRFRLGSRWASVFRTRTIGISAGGLALRAQVDLLRRFRSGNCRGSLCPRSR